MWKPNHPPVDPIRTLAVAKAIKDKEVEIASDAVSPGEYSGEVTVKISYSLTKGEDQEKVIAMALDPWGLIECLADALNPAVFAARLQEHLTDPGKHSGENVKARVRAAIEAAKLTTKKRTRGPVTGTVITEIIG